MLLIIATAAIAFITTNIDDILLLMIFFGQVNASFRKRHIVVGHYLGFGLIVLISLLGFAGTTILPPNLIRFLGLIPIALGLYQLFRKHKDDDDDETPNVTQVQPNRGFIGSLLSVHTLSVAGVTLANGADNISVYVPLFANHSLPDVLLIIVIFGLLVGVWLYAGYRLVRYPAVARLLDRYGERLVPYVFILLGLYILLT
ncbi:MAG: cadmium resistance transporter [Anaerolineae bacterium]|nr:cadmium resistance transporter [Anaerolineae bacterium]